MNPNKLLEMAHQVGLMQEHIIMGAPDDLFVKIGQLANLCYQAGVAESAIPVFAVEDFEEEETMSFSIGGVVVFTADHDRHGWDGMSACRSLFFGIAHALDMVQEVTKDQE